MMRREFRCTPFQRWLLGCFVLSCILMYLIQDAYQGYQQDLRKAQIYQLSQYYVTKPPLNVAPNVVPEKPEPDLRPVPKRPQMYPDNIRIPEMDGTVRGVDILGSIDTTCKYAVYGAATQQGRNYGHAFYLPLTAKAWNRIGYRSVVILIGTPESWYADVLLQHVLSHLRQQNATVVFLQSSQEHEVMMSQISRIFVPNILLTNFQNIGNVYLITTDADLWPLDAASYDLPNQKDILSVNSECCGGFIHNQRHFKMLPMANIGMKIRTWKQVIDYNHMLPATPTEIIRFIYKEFGSVALQPVNKGENEGWYLDQHTVSILVQNYVDRLGNPSLVHYLPRNTGEDRMDRNAWDPRSIWQKMDVHLPEDPFLSRVWGRVLPLLNLLYGENEPELKWCMNYFEKFQSIMFGRDAIHN